MTAPSGEQIGIAAAGQQAVVVEVGGGLRSYLVAGSDLLDGYPAAALCRSGRGQVLLPWPNRLQGGSYEFGGARHQVPLDEPESNNAIHGLVRWANWAVGERAADRVVMELALHPRPGYPFSLDLSIEYALSAEGLRVRTAATNTGPDACPFGSGAHPYLTAGTETIDSVVLSAPAGTVLRADEHGIPDGRDPVDGTEYDFREPRPIGATRLDHAFTDLVRGEDGLARVELRRPGGDGGVQLWADESYGFLMLFTGDPLPDVDRRSLAVEPMTCAPNAFRSGDGLIVLEPGESFAGEWGIGPL